MYKPVQKKSSSWTPASIQNKSKSKSKPGTFSVQPKSESKSSQQQETPDYSSRAADALAANVMRSLETPQQEQEEAHSVQRQIEPGAAFVVDSIKPITPSSTPSIQSKEAGIQRQCSECAKEQQEELVKEGKDSDEMSVWASAIQTKLTVGAPGDKYEQEADRVAAQVMSMSVTPDSSPQVQRFKEENNPVQRWSLAQSITPVVQRQVDQQVQLREIVQRAFQAGGTQASGDLESRLNASIGGGSALAPEVRAFMEPRFGADFSSVRVHTGAEAVQMNRELGAQAFAHGSDIYFGAGKSPGNNELTAHELTHVVQQSSTQVQPIQCKKENEDALAAIQGYAMFALLPALDELRQKKPQALNDEEAGGFVGGSRLVTAMRAVKAKGMQWLDFAAAHNAGLGVLPSDQISDIMRFLGAPKDARYFTADQLGKQFDGAVVPASGSVTLFFRVRFELAPTRIGWASPGTPEWQKEARKASQKIRQEFAPEFKRVVEEQWSGKGMVKPACPIGSIKALQTKVVVTVVESGEHMVMYIHPEDSEGRSNASSDEGVGNLKANSNKPRTRPSQVVDPTGRHPEQIITTQITSAHEFGHAIGLDHSRCPGNEDRCYGVTAEERNDIMGAGNKLQVIKRAGKILHDDFAPFEHIAEHWGKEFFPGALAKCNKWSAG